jgi:starvation-inducible DNA-binding protein
MYATQDRITESPPPATDTVGIGLPVAERRAVVAILNTVLADEFVLYTKTRRVDWNGGGPRVGLLHALFQKQYERLGQIVDDVAERARALDGVAAGSLEEYLELTRLDEDNRKRHDAPGMIASLLADHERLARVLRVDLESCAHDYGDDGTTDFLTSLMQAHEKIAWMLRAHLRETPLARAPAG